MHLLFGDLDYLYDGRLWWLAICILGVIGIYSLSYRLLVGVVAASYI